ncbi:hypothetical protein [Natrinema gelatinilyticum]|uniref:hypothetical protein n=1 Tax=Natrinema gelatinilyticum TaxID=2961571 RepID=UPI0020C201B5|nr:hypothetical protein [Natrinema gelatinilyticum]
MSVSKGRLDGRLSDIDPVVAMSIPIVVAPFGFLIGSLFFTHLVRSEIEAVWLTTVALTVLSFFILSWRY